MSVDLNPIGFGISSGISRNGFGSIVSFPSVSFPAYGTVISGPTDTSRNEFDFGGFAFFMPYSTIVYADGIGGTYSTETWGLQYFPAGWRTGSGSTDYNVNVQQLGGYFKAGEDFFYYIEDGTGINYIGGIAGVLSRYAYGTSIGSANDYNYFWDGNGSYYNTYTPSYPSYGTFIDGSSGNVYFTTPSCGDYVVGTYSYNNYHDGNGGTYMVGGESYLAYGTVLGTCGDYTYYSNNSNDPKAYWHYYNGYVLGYSTQSTTDNGWAYGNAGGTYLSSEQRTNSIADGYGNSNAGYPYTWYPPYGTVLASSSYSYQWMDENGENQSTTTYFDVLADGAGSYTILNT